MNQTSPDRRQCILVIDDEEVVRFLFQSLLEEAGFQSFLASDGRQGVEMLDRHAPAVALVDKNLPDMSGLDLIEAQKKRHPDTEFIMITGYASLDSAVKAMEVGAFSYLTKPFDEMDTVLDRIRAALEVNSLRVETALLRDRLNIIEDEQERPGSPVESAGGASHHLIDQVLYTISFLESFVDKRGQIPSPADWARTIDRLEEAARLLKQAFEGK
ncbi:MAG: response regulator [Deltaproteobacteria bacterium]|nr:response regulator [Deltaproteobacteria bacterium]MBW1870565.1 response regulator [Deltaproteobacteria bacterium]